MTREHDGECALAENGELITCLRDKPISRLGPGAAAATGSDQLGPQRDLGLCCPLGFGLEDPNQRGGMAQAGGLELPVGLTTGSGTFQAGEVLLGEPLCRHM